jgi:hypothetical protein
MIFLRRNSRIIVSGTAFAFAVLLAQIGIASRVWICSNPDFGTAKQKYVMTEQPQEYRARYTRNVFGEFSDRHLSWYEMYDIMVPYNDEWIDVFEWYMRSNKLYLCASEELRFGFPFRFATIECKLGYAPALGSTKRMVITECDGFVVAYRAYAGGSGFAVRALPLVFSPIAVAGNMLIYVLASTFVYLTVAYSVSKYRIHKHRCEKCGYQLDKTQSVCPECGPTDRIN